MTASPASTPTLHVSEEAFLATYADLKPAYEYVNGEVTQKPMPKKPHYDLAEELVFRLGAYRRERGREGSSGPEPTVNLSRDKDRRYRAPDVAYWAPGRPVAAPDGIFLPPTLAIEIQSPGQTLAFLRAKCREYRDRGTDVVWLVLPSRGAVEVFDDAGDGIAFSGDEMLAPAQLPGFTVPVRELFATIG
ncbi:MAG: Uma2 family endonuclease [Chloroflexi bacterium]|nr:Uma2 family endonuclease [Chloroflexota bacterium]